MKIKKGDNVIIIAGKDRGKTGKILKSYPLEERVLVEGLNLRSRRVRPRRSNEKGQTVSKPHPIQVSNVALYCAHCKKGVRLGTKVEGNKKTRICRKCGRAI